jgi:hypothetical protein
VQPFEITLFFQINPKNGESPRHEKETGRFCHMDPRGSSIAAGTLEAMHGRNSGQETVVRRQNSRTIFSAFQYLGNQSVPFSFRYIRYRPDIEDLGFAIFFSGGGLFRLCKKVLQVARFGQVIEGAFLQRFNGGRNRGVSGEHDDFHQRMLAFQDLKSFNAIRLGHFDIKNNNVDGIVFGKEVQRLGPGKSAEYGKSPFAQAQGRRFNKLFFIIDQKKIE